MSCVSLLRSERKWRITIFLLSTYLRGSQSMATLSTCLLSCSPRVFWAASVLVTGRWLMTMATAFHAWDMSSSRLRVDRTCLLQILPGAGWDSQSPVTTHGPRRPGVTATRDSERATVHLSVCRDFGGAEHRTGYSHLSQAGPGAGSDLQLHRHRAGPAGAIS